tara:strand:+ start:1077 stop:1511 length:435 start_codon:yes stop_codon:yes gene_type:complete
MQSDYLKYWRVIRYFIRAKYKLTTADIETLLFLKTESYFGKDKFREFRKLLSWDKSRFERLLRDGWIQVFRKRTGKSKTLYCLSYKSKRVINSIYKKLNGEEIPTSPSQNPMFLKNVSYTDRVYRSMIEDMNKFIKQQRHHSEI